MKNLNKLNRLAYFAGFEIVTDISGQIYLIKDGNTTVPADSVRAAVLMVPMQYRKGLMDQWLFRNQSVVEPMYKETAQENESTETRFKNEKDLRGKLI